MRERGRYAVNEEGIWLLHGRVVIGLSLPDLVNNEVSFDLRVVRRSL